MKPRHLLLVALAVLPLFAWLALRERTSAPHGTQSPPTLADVSTRDTAGSPNAPVTAQPLVQRSELEPTNAQRARAPTTLRVQVVATDGTPCARTTVVWLPQFDPDRRTVAPATHRLSRDGWLARARANGGHATTDALGEAVIDVVPTRLRVLAWDAERLGAATVERTSLDADAPCRIVLHPSFDWRIRVLDASRTPIAGLAVTMNTVTEADGRRRVTAPIDVGPTDADGMLIVHHAGELARSIDPRRSATVAELRLRIFGVEDAPLWIDLAAPPPEPIEWVLAPTGSVELNFVDAGAQPFNRVTLSPPFDARSAGANWALDVADPSLPFVVERIGLGLRLSARASFGADQETPLLLFTGEGDGPRRAGERARIELRREPSRDLTGRLVDAHGAPVDASRVTLTDGVDAALRGPAFAGRFRIVVPDAHAERLLTDPRLNVDDANGAVGFPTLPASRLPGDHSVDLGDVLVVSHPLVVGGVVTVDGAPAARRGFGVQTFDESSGEWTPWLADGATRTDGTFRIVGAPMARRLRLSVASGDCVPIDPIEFVRGTDDLRVALSRGGSLRVVVMVPTTDSGRLGRPLPEVTLMPANGDVHAKPRTLREAESVAAVGGRAVAFVAIGLAPGRWQVVVRTPLLAAPLHDAVIDVDAATALDPAITRVDLRRTLRAVALTLVHGENVPLRHGRITLVASGVAGEWKTDARVGRVELLVPAAGVDIDVRGPFDRQVVRLPALAADATVRIDPVATRIVELSVGTPAALPAQTTAGVVIDEESAAIGSAPFARVPLRGRPSESVPLVVGARYRLRVEITGPRGTATIELREGVVHVQPGASAQPFVVDYDPEDWQRAVDRVR